MNAIAAFVGAKRKKLNGFIPKAGIQQWEKQSYPCRSRPTPSVKRSSFAGTKVSGRQGRGNHVALIPTFHSTFPYLHHPHHTTELHPPPTDVLQHSLDELVTGIHDWSRLRNFKTAGGYEMYSKDSVHRPGRSTIPQSTSVLMFEIYVSTLYVVD